VLIDDLEKAVARASFFPVIPACSGTASEAGMLEIVTTGFRRHRNTAAEVFTPQGKAATGWPATERSSARRGGQDHVDPYVGRSAWSGCSPEP